MPLIFPDLKTQEDTDDWCKHLYRELSYPFTVYAGNQTVWDDLRVSLFTSKVPAADYPGFEQVKDDGAASTGVFAYHFADDEYVFLATQMPHAWKEGSTIYPHIHFMTTTDVSPADNFKIGLEYSWTGIGDVAGNTSTISIDVSTGVNSSYKHQIANISSTGIAGTGYSLSSVLLCRLYRAAADSDNYAGDVIITDFDIHFESDTHGSRGIIVK